MQVNGVGMACLEVSNVAQKAENRYINTRAKFQRTANISASFVKRFGVQRESSYIRDYYQTCHQSPTLEHDVRLLGMMAWPLTRPSRASSELVQTKATPSYSKLVLSCSRSWNWSGIIERHHMLKADFHNIPSRAPLPARTIAKPCTRIITGMEALDSKSVLTCCLHSPTLHPVFNPFSHGMSSEITSIPCEALFLRYPQEPSNLSSSITTGFSWRRLLSSSIIKACLPSLS